MIDLAVTEAAKSAKNDQASTSGEYQQRFNKMLKNRGGALWSFLEGQQDISINVYYASSIAEMISSGGTAGNANNMPLARYKLEYHYQPMFFPFPHFWVDNLLNREVIFVQEYERSKFFD